MTGPRYSDSGELLLSSFDSLSYQDIRQWVTERLFGTDTGFAPAPGDMPHYLIALIYPNLSASPRNYLERAVFDLLAKIAFFKPAEWLDSSGEELLLLVDPVLINDPRQNQIIDNIIRLVSDLTGAIPCGIALKALQALVTLDYHPSPRFWFDQYRRIGKDALPTVLEGLARTDFSIMLDWLSNIGWNESATDALVAILPFLIETNGVREIRRTLATRYSELPPLARDSIEEFCLLEGFSIVDLAERLDERDPFIAVEALLPVLELHMQNLTPSDDSSNVSQALSTLGKLMPKFSMKDNFELGESGRSVWEAYVRVLKLALRLPRVSSSAFEQLIAQLPPAEAIEITQLVRRENYVVEEECRTVLLRYYDSIDASRFMEVNDKHDEVDEDFFTTSITEALMRDVSKDSIVAAICLEDDKVPRNKDLWISSLLPGDYLQEGRV